VTFINPALGTGCALRLARVLLHRLFRRFLVVVVAVLGVTAAALLWPRHIKQVLLVGIVVLGGGAHPTLTLVADVNHVTVEENLAINLTHGLLDHLLVTQLALVRQIVILEDELAQHLRHIALLVVEALDLVLFLLHALPDFVLSDGQRVIEKAEAWA